MGTIGDIATGGASQVLGIGLGAIQNAQTQHMMQTQQNNQMALNAQGAQLARDNWDYTNYENQVKHMENAGLNVGLMYGSGGSGGSTTASTGSGGSASSGQAAKIDNGMGLMLQNKAIESQIEVNKSEIVKKQAETKEIEARTPTYGKGMQKTDAEIKNLASLLGVNEAKAKEILQNIEESKSNVNKNKALIDNMNAGTNKINQTLPYELNNLESQTGLNQQKIKESVALVEKMLSDRVNNGINAYANQRNANANETNANTNMYRQIADQLYQNGMLENKDEDQQIEIVKGIVNFIEGRSQTSSETHVNEQYYRDKKGRVTETSRQTRTKTGKR